MEKVNLNYEKKYEEIVKNKLLDLFKGISGRILLFGSRARGEYRRGADFDIGIESVDLETFQRLRVQFEDFWEESIIPYKVDLLLLDKVNPDFKKEAMKDVIIWKTD
jgi:predicted nucleotidyltransferase